MSEPSIREPNGADMDGGVEQAIRFPANQFAPRARSPAEARQYRQ
jgi:hypothetical protein